MIVGRWIDRRFGSGIGVLRDFFRRRKLKQLSANMGHAAVRNPQTARSA
jgi:hypothetical protein